MGSDLISRYALVKDLEKVFCDNCDNYNEIRCRACLMDDALGYIDAQPTVDAVEVVHGRWSMVKVGETRALAKCSACGRKMNPLQYGYAYCGLCGAKMDGDRE